MLKTDVPYWYRILDHFEKRRYFSNGLTIPFLIGARSILEPNVAALSVDNFLTEASSLSLPKPISILKCGNINEFVFGLLDNETILIKKSYKNLYKEIGNLIFIDTSFSQEVQLNEVSSKLSDIYEPLISKKMYSKNNGTWGGYQPTDLDRLKEVCNLIINN